MPRNRSVGRPAPRPTASRSAPLPARVQQAPPPAVPQRSGGSMMGGLASTVAEGVAFGTGSAIRELHKLISFRLQFFKTSNSWYAFQE
ncbi:hypothetical protein R1flu_029254 [Riccia fluitans]|uniref:Uncharacterized protein n=1 Tax=Riccia fluitans TaxID=41844 RepID=A0ABD1XRW1_9MARC